jgi:hypothetical protein
MAKSETPEVARDFMRAVRETAHKAKAEEAREGDK